MSKILPSTLSTSKGERWFTIIRGMISKKRLKEERFFKNDFRIYVATHYANHIEVWSHNQRPEYPNSDTGLLLGKITKGKLEKPKDFYTFPYSVQRSAEKVFRIMGV